MSKLFRDNIEVRELIKLKAVYEHLESDLRPLRGRGQHRRGHRPRKLLIPRPRS